MIKKTYLFIGLIMLMLLTGCWDNIPIEERGFVVGSAIDMKDSKTNGNYDLTLTNQFIVPTGLSTGINQSGGPKAYMNLSASGTSVFAIDEAMASLTSKIPFFQHLKVLVVSKELVNTPHLLANIMDVFERDKEMRRSIKVIVAEDEAKKVLNALPENEQIPTMYINDLLEESLEKTSLFKPIHVGNIHEYLLTNESFTIPEVTNTKGEMEYVGGAIFNGHDDRVVGTMTKDEMTGMNLITGGTHGGIIEFEYKDHLITFSIFNAKREMDIDTTDPHHLKINMDVGLEGGIVELFGNLNVKDPKTISELEDRVSEEVEKIVNQSIAKSKELNAEVFEISKILRERHYDTWQKIEGNWDSGENYYVKSDIHVKAKARIRTGGASRKSESYRKE
jgi:spore germination protein